MFAECFVLVGDIHIVHFDRLKEGLQPVEIFRRDRVVLVIVAACAADGPSEKDGTGDGGDLVQIVLPHIVGNQIRTVPRSEPQIAHRDVALDVGRIVVARLAVLIAPRDLFDNEAIVGHVFIESVHNPVAVSPRIADCSVAFQTAGLAIADKIKPVPAPANAIA